MFGFSNILSNFLQKDLRFITTVGTKPHKIVVPHLEDEVFKGIENGTMTPKKHPGRIKPDLIQFDDNVVNTIKSILKDTVIKLLLKDTQVFCNYIKSRHPPVTKDELTDQKNLCINEVLKKMNVDPTKMSSEDQVSRFEKNVSKKVNIMLKRRIYAWAPVKYSSYVGKMYLVNRMPAEYAALNRIFLEISNRCPDFKPNSFLDFGSGVGTVTSAVRKYWENSIREYYCIDASAEMHKLAKLMLTGGDPEAALPIRHVFYRQYLPARADITYDLVVCSYTLFDLPSKEIRLQTLSKLWNKTNDFFIIVEQGTTQGFKLIEEARKYILHVDAISECSSGIHIFSPCPHEESCPQAKISDKPCCFRAHYMKLPIGRRSTIMTEYFSYVVFRKSQRPGTDLAWPRVMRPILRKKQMAVCQLCTKEGKLRKLIFTKAKHGKMNYHVGRSVKSGDRLPMSFSDCYLDDFNDEDVEVCDVTSEDEILDYDDEIENEYDK